MTSTSSTRARRLVRCLSAGLVAMAIATPAQARSLTQDGLPLAWIARPPADVQAPLDATPTSATPVILVHHAGFDWTDATIGAAATTGLIALLGAGLITITRSRRREREPRAAQQTPAPRRR
jgi:hypothetical protein